VTVFVVVLVTVLAAVLGAVFGAGFAALAGALAIAVVFAGRYVRLLLGGCAGPGKGAVRRAVTSAPAAARYFKESITCTPERRPNQARGNCHTVPEADANILSAVFVK